VSPDDRFAQLSPEKRALLEKQLLARRAGAKAMEGTGLRRRRPGEPLVLSVAQQQLWFLSQWQRGGEAYNASLNLRLQGRLDEKVLLRAFGTIVQRHETLRTLVEDHGGVPVARLLEHAQPSFAEVDVQEGGGSDKAVAAAAEGLVAKPFDLARDLPLRIGLIRIGPEERVICIIVHHIACDGLSRGVLFDELTALYSAYLEGRPSPLPELPVQYGDYAEWQQRWLSGENLRKELDFWRAELAGTDLLLDLPLDHPRPDVLTFDGRRVDFAVPLQVSEALKGLGRQERATIFMVIHAAAGCFLYGLTGQEDFLVGSPVSDRRWPETEKLIGFFINTVVLRLRLSGDPSFREVVRRSRATLVNCYAHQDFPFERVVQAVRPKRVSNRNPLFQVNLRMQGPSPQPPQLPGLKASRVSLGFESARFDLALGFVDEPNELRGYIEFNTALFDEATINRWSGLLVDLLGRAVADPEQRLSGLAEPLRHAIAGP